MKFNSTAVKATLFSMLVTASSTVFANNLGYHPTPTPTPTPECFPTPICFPTPTCNPTPIPTPINNGVSPVPEPSAWISFAVGAALLVALAVYNKSKFGKSTD